jgi:vacuolar-type H+-ATPase subunit I/STV1
MTDAERQQRRRDRRKAGLVRIEAWVPAQAEDAVRAAIDRAVAEAADGVEQVKREVG